MLVVIALACFWATCVAARADEPAKGLEVHEVSLWIIDPGSKLANFRSAYPSALPVTVNSPRAADSPLAARSVAPISLITFHGQEAADLDVDLRTSAGSFLAHWPPGEGMPNRLRWSGTPAYSLVEKIEDEAEMVFVDGDNWAAKARGGDALYVKRGARSERFLAYDAELNLDAPVRLEGGPDKFNVVNLTGAPLYDVLIARRTPQGIRVAWLDELEKGDAPAPAAAPKDGPANPKPGAKPDVNPFSVTVAAPGIVGQGAPPFQAPPAGVLARIEIAQAAEAPPAVPATPAAKPNPPASTKKPGGGLFGGLPSTVNRAKGVEVTLSEPMPADSPEAAAKTTKSLAERLAKAGLSPFEAQQFADHFAALFFSGEALVVACRLPQASIDEKIPISVFPAPTKTVRVAMVLVRNGDPQFGGEVERLIAQLGDPKFSVREAAQKRLMEYGPLAFGALNKALANADLEIVIRAERILLNQNQTPDAAGAPAVPAVQRGVILRGGVLRVAPAPVIIGN